MLRKKAILIGVLLVLLLNVNSVAQDPHFSQFYSAQTFLSPSLAGSSGGTRYTANYRNQWPGIQKTYQTYAVSADFYLSEFRSGFGALLVTDKAGSASLNTTNLGLQYSFRVPISDNIQFVPGLQFTFGQKSLDRSKLIFPDEVVTETPSSGQFYLTNTKAQYVDFITSVFLYSRTVWMGFVADHLLRPNYSFMGDKTILPLKIVNFGGMNFWQPNARRIDDPRLASLCYRFEVQNGFKQLDVGGYVYGKVFDFGIWYRGLPIFKNQNIENHYIDNDAVVLSVGVSTNALHITYSYDLQLSKLAAYGSGAHEVSIGFEMNKLLGCVDCFSRRSAIQFHKNRPRNMKVN